MRQNKNKQILCFSFSSVYPFVRSVLCPGHCLFWKVYILFFFLHGMVECYLIRNKWVSKSKWRRPFKELLWLGVQYSRLLWYVEIRQSFWEGKGWRCWKLNWKLSQTILCWLQRDMTALNDFHFGCPALNSQLWTGKLEFK